MGMYMSKKSFNALSIKEQVLVFNKFIKEENLNITKCCERIGISYSTVRDRFRKNNYIYNKFAKQYENINDIFYYNEDNIVNRVIEEINKNINILGKLQLNPCNKQNVVNRSFGIDKATLDRFVHFCDNSSYKQYDILTKFIEEGISKYSRDI